MPIPISEDLFPPIVWRRVRANAAVLRDHRPLDREIVARLRQQMRVQHTYHSNAIEGNSLTLLETRLVLEEGLTIGGKSLKDHVEATNNARAFDWIWDLPKRRIVFDHVLVQRLHELVMRGISEWAGRYRAQQVWIVGARHTPPPPEQVVPMMDATFTDVKRIADPIVRSIYLQHRLVYVHPFVDGNGRTTRLAANLALLRGGLPPVVLRVGDRRRYYAALQAADDGDYAPFASYVLRALDEALVLWLAAVDRERALVPLRRLARGSRYSQEYLSLRARQGVLEAVKIDGVWHASRRAVEDYIESVARGA